MEQTHRHQRHDLGCCSHVFNANPLIGLMREIEYTWTVRNTVLQFANAINTALVLIKGVVTDGADEPIDADLVPGVDPGFAGHFVFCGIR